MTPIVKGSLKSKTNWLGLSVVVLGYMQLPEAKQAIEQYLPANFVALANMSVGLGVIVTRFFTAQSLTEKGSE
jgi:hypothetical protein